MNDIRPASKSGSWYPSDPAELQQLLAVFAEEAATKIRLEKLADRPCTAAITPHAGLVFSGSCAAKAFYALSLKHPTPNSIIIFGASHTPFAGAAGVWSSGSWQTPLGEIEVDSELAKEVLCLEYTETDYISQRYDNAIELQTPLLKYFFPTSRILPISTPPSTKSADLGADIARLVKSMPGNYLVIGSSDLTHYGATYGFAPAGNGIEGIDWARANDLRLIKIIESLEIERIIPEAAQHHNACGSGAITATVSFARTGGAESALTLQHVLSHDIMPSDPPELSVGYASIII